MKKIISIIIAFFTALFSPTQAELPQTETSSSVPIFTEQSEQTEPTFKTEDYQPVLLNQHTLQTNTRFSISEDGTARVYVDCMGYRECTTGIAVSVKIEKQTASVNWEEIYSYTYFTEGEYYYNAFVYPLSGQGTYRCTVVYTVSGNGGKDDVITFEDIKEYIPKKENDENFEYARPEPAGPGRIFPDGAVSLAANALTKHIDLGETYALIHGEKGYIANDDIFGEHYILGDAYGIYTYKEGDASAYFSCEDAYCSHSECGAVKAEGLIFAIGDTLYRIENGKIYSRLSDGTWHTEWQSEGGAIHIGSNGAIPLYTANWHNILPYGPYIYITAYSENGEARIWQYDTDTKTMTDITSYTGSFIHYEFAYDGYLYGYNKDRSEFIRREIHFLGPGSSVPYAIENAFTKDFRINLTMDSLFVGVLYDENGESLGIMTFDIEKQKTDILYNEDLGQTVLGVIGADDSYFYFLDQNDRGKIYRVNRNGSDVCTIYDSESTYIYAYQMLLHKDKVLLYAGEIGMIDGREKIYADGWHIGTLDENGQITSLEWLEALQ